MTTPSLRPASPGSSSTGVTVPDHAGGAATRRPSGPRWLRAAATHATLVALYGATLVGLTWPLARHAATHLPTTWLSAATDQPTLAWALAWQTHAMTTAGARWSQGNIFHPSPDALFYGEAAFGALPYFAPVFLLTRNPVLALNCVFLACLTLTCWSLHVVTRRWTGSHAAGTLAAASFLGTRWVLWAWIAAAPTYAVLQYLPFIVFLAAREARRLRESAALGLLVAVQSLTSLYVAIAVAVPLAATCIAQLLVARTRRAGLWTAGATAGGLLAAAPFWAGYLTVRIAEPGVTSQTSWPYAWRTLLPWGPIGYWSPTGVPLLTMGLVVVACACRRRLPPRALRHAVTWAVVGSLLPLAGAEWDGHHLGTLLGGSIAAGPLRIPQRLGVSGLIGLSLLAGLGAGALAARAGRAIRIATTVLAAAAIAVEYHHGAGSGRYARVRTQTFRVVSGTTPAGFAMPAAMLPLGPLPSSYPIRAVEAADDPGVTALLSRDDGPLLDLPASRADGLEAYLEAGGVGRPELQAAAMLRAIRHWRPLVNGHSSFYPRAFRDRMALVRRLPDDTALATLVAATGLSTIVVRTALLAPPDRTRWLAVGDGRGRLRLAGRSGDVLVYAVTDAVPLGDDVRRPPLP